MSETQYLATHPVARALEIFGDRWTILIMREVFLRNHRFSTLQRCTGASKGTLSHRLGKLIEENILYKVSYNNSGKRYEYHLTDKGLTAYSWALMLWQWELAWAGNVSGPLPGSLTHQHTDSHPLIPVAVCRHCQLTLQFDDVERVAVRTGPNPGDEGSAGLSAFLGRQRKTTAKDDDNHSLNHIAAIIGDRWTLLVLGCAFTGLTRFDEVLQQLGIASNILSDRLRQLVANGILDKIDRTEGRHHRYQLTDKGKSLYPQTMVLRQWALEQLPAVNHPVVLIHAPCGHKLETDVLCESCKAIPRARDVSFG